MKQADIRIGGHYLTRVGGALAPVEVVCEVAASYSLLRRGRPTRYLVRRVDTGRILTGRTAAALRSGCRCDSCKAATP